MIKVLLVEDEPALARIVKDSLETRGFAVRLAVDGRHGLSLYQEERPDILVLDVMMPRLDGFSLAAEIRKNDAGTPIIFLTAKSQSADVVKGFELGGDDYLKKPFSMEELIARIHARLRAAPSPDGAAEANAYILGDFTFDPVRQVLLHPQGEQALSHRESELLRLLCRRRNQVLERAPALRDLWGDDSFFNARSMDVFITKLRRYLRRDARVKIINSRGVGYKLIVEEQV
jgi:two-component system response regulator VicR